jgi:hypothetical protein
VIDLPVCGFEPLEDAGGDVFADDFLPALRPDEAAHGAGADLHHFPGRQEEDGGDIRVELAVDITYRFLVFVVCGAPNTPQDEFGAHALGVLDEKLVGVLVNGDVAAADGRLAQHVDTVLEREVALLIGVGAHGNDQFVEKGGPGLDHPQVTESDRIECPGIYRNAAVFFHFWLQSLTASKGRADGSTGSP